MITPKRVWTSDLALPDGDLPPKENTYQLSHGLMDDIIISNVQSYLLLLIIHRHIV